MDKFDNTFKFEDTYKPLTSVELVDPDTVISSGKYYPLNKQSSRVLNSNLGLRSYQFSHQLYSHDNELWKILRDKKNSDDSISEYKKSYYIMIIDDIVVSVIENNKYLSEFMSIIDELVKDETMNYFYSYKDDEFQFLALSNSENKSGFIIRYFLSSNWISIRNAYYANDDTLYLSYNSICDKVIEDDLKLILDKDVLMMSTEFIKDEYETFCNKSSELKISFEELFNYLKYDFKIKIKYTRIDPFEFLANTEYNTEVSNFISDVLTYIYDTDSYRYVNAPYLRKSIQFSKYSFYNYYKIISSMYMDNQISVNSLINLVELISRNKTNFSQIKD